MNTAQIIRDNKQADAYLAMFGGIPKAPKCWEPSFNNGVVEVQFLETHEPKAGADEGTIRPGARNHS